MTPDQLRKLQTAIEDRYGFIAAQMQSEGYQPDPEQLKRWQRLGLIPEHITPETFALSVPAELHIIRNAFILGRMAEAVERGETFEAVMAAAIKLPLRKPDLLAIQVAEQQTALRRVDDLLSAMSGPDHRALWTDDAVCTHPRWAEVRSQARRAVTALGWEE